MPIGEIIGDAIGQLAMEAGGEAIHRKFGWVGCVVAIAIPLGAIALLFWLID